MPTPRSNRLACTAVVFGASLAMSADPAGASGDDASGAVVESTGDSATSILLPPAPAVGDRAAVATDIDVTISAGASAIGFALRLDSSTSVDEVDADGGYATTNTFDSLVVTSGADRIDPEAFGALTGMSYRQTFARNGTVTSVEAVDPDPPTDEQLVAFASITDNLEGAQVVYPDVPVGVGARWTVEQAVSGDAFPVVAEYRYELTAIEGDRYTIAVSYAAAFDTIVDGVATVGTVAGLGSLSGSTSNPLDVSYRLGQTTDGTAGGNTVHVEVTVTLASTPAP